MGRFHIVLPRQMQLAQAAQRAACQQGPRHAICELSNQLSATVYEPDASPVSTVDRLRTAVAPPSNLWALARRVHSTAKPNDVIFCSSEAGGLQVAALYDAREARPRIAVFVHNVDRPRARFALRWWRVAQKVDLFLACSEMQVEFLRHYLGLSSDRVRHISDHTDTLFFRPGPASTKARPVIASVGLEQRDYKTLAEATHDLNADVRISGFSKDAVVMARSFPGKLPANMSRRFYEWPELLQLYRDADVVVISCFENKYAAGVQSLMEAMACKRPIIATATSGLKGYFDDSIITIRPNDPQKMRETITQVLQNNLAAEARAASGYAHALQLYSLDRYVKEIGDALRSLAPHNV
jgi:glycosyltransferase involved in cell wall biosynthesis